MSAFAQLAPVEKLAAYREASLRKNVLPVIVEKDFWVCWLLGQIFATPELGAQCVFKGGTSLSKVFRAIDRFSEDVDLGLTPASLGWSEADLDEAPSPTQRRKRAEQMMADCAVAVRTLFQPELEAAVHGVLGPRAKADWLDYTDDPTAHSPVLRFYYPSIVPTGTAYIERAVRIEFGSLTDQRPTGSHPIEPLIAELAPGAFADFRADVVALEIERTFWEKATILHAEYHRPAAQALRDRYARHYADFAALWRHPGGQRAATQLDLLARVRLHKSRYFSSSWAHYATAVPGTLHLLPPADRLAELRRDYAAMEPMFLSPPLKFEEMLTVLHAAEHTLNQS
ncbi:MAG: nucleotidyl transferase AbiEii/AbiGii toxin family protein [Limisphaerales bacterium]